MDSTTPTPETTFYQCQKPTPVKAGTQSPNGFLESEGTTVKRVWVENPPAMIGFPSAVIAEVPIHDYQVTTGDVHNLGDHWGLEHKIWQQKTV